MSSERSEYLIGAPDLDALDLTQLPASHSQVGPGGKMACRCAGAIGAQHAELLRYYDEGEHYDDTPGGLTSDGINVVLARVWGPITPEQFRAMKRADVLAGLHPACRNPSISSRPVRDPAER